MIPHAGTLKLHKLSVATEGPSLQLLGENHLVPLTFRGFSGFSSHTVILDIPDRDET